jgi:heme oxygenase (biliverdin-IX-beta and delta-forming)
VNPSPVGECGTQIGLRSRLRTATAALHRSLETRLDLLSPHLSLERYQRLLRGFHGYYAAIEPRLVELARQTRATFGIVARTGHLEQDLLSLGVPPDAIAAAPRCAELPALLDREHLAGCLYVLEGSRLGGRVIARFVEEHLGLTRSRGCCFFADVGQEATRRWTEVVSWLEGHAEPGVDQGQIVSSAAETFRSLERWLAASEALSQ